MAGSPSLAGDAGSPLPLNLAVRGHCQSCKPSTSVGARGGHSVNSGGMPFACTILPAFAVMTARPRRIGRMRDGDVSGYGETSGAAQQSGAPTVTLAQIGANPERSHRHSLSSPGDAV